MNPFKYVQDPGQKKATEETNPPIAFLTYLLSPPALAGVRREINFL
jgi:hypothetical protein